MVDAGSSGVSNYQRLLQQCRDNKVRSRIMLNVSACGIIMPTQFSEPVDPGLWNLALFDEAFEKNRNEIIGLKIRISRNVVKNLGLNPLKETVRLAERYHTRAVVHVTDAPESMSEVAKCLRPGDVFCHVYHGIGHTILQADGSIEPEILAARERGVLFDVASGRGNFSLKIAEEALKQGFLPDTISSDMTLQNWHNCLAGSLPFVMSRFLALGMSVSDIVSRVTTEPAKQFGIDGLGTLCIGSQADISVFSMENSSTSFFDKFGNEKQGSVMFVPKATFINGRLLYRAVDAEILKTE